MTIDLPSRRRFCVGVGAVGAALMMARRGVAASAANAARTVSMT